MNYDWEAQAAAANCEDAEAGPVSSFLPPNPSSHPSAVPGVQRLGANQDRAGPLNYFSAGSTDNKHIPGSSVNDINPRAVFLQLIREFFRKGTGLCSFATSSMRKTFVSYQGANKCRNSPHHVWPMPMPYPAACSLDPGTVGDTDLKKIVTNLLVISFNYLDLGRPTRAPDDCLGGNRLNEAQWEQVLRLESFLDAWFEIGILTAETMGRTAGKVEDLERLLSNLRVWKHDHKISDEVGKRRSTECGTFKGPKISTFKQVEASRLQFRGRPEFDPKPYLDSTTRAIYENPFKHSVSPEQFEGEVPHVKVHCSRSERIKLYELLDSSGRIQLFRPEQVRSKYTSGVFAVLKSLSLDRLILDSRPHNLLESPPGKFIRTLGAADTVCRLHLEPGEWLYTSTNDIRDFYHLFRVGEQRACRNALVGTVSPGEVKHFKSFRDSFRGEAKLYAGLSCLAMGDTQAVEIAQTCHVGLLFQSGLLHEQNMLCMGVPAPREQTCTGVVIDDHVCLSIERRGPDSVKFAPTDGAILADTAQEIYKGVNLIPHEAKAVRDSLHGEFWGLQVDGVCGLVRGSLKRGIPPQGYFGCPRDWDCDGQPSRSHSRWAHSAICV